MRRLSRNLAASAVLLGALGAGILTSTSANADSSLSCPNLKMFHESGGAGVPTDEMMPRLQALESAKGGEWSPLEIAACYKELADQYRDRGSYRAEKLYLRAVKLSREPMGDPHILEAVARYYRTFRGTKGLFAESEDYYLRAEQAVDAAIEAVGIGVAQDPEMVRLREEIIRGRIELNKREGLGVLIPSQPEHRLGFYLGSQVGYGEFPISHSGLAGEHHLARDHGKTFDSLDILREPTGLAQYHRLRLRLGQYPYVDLGWHDVDLRNAIADPPDGFKDFAVDEIEIGLEDTFGRAPMGDVLWRFEYRRGESNDEDWWNDADSDRLTGLLTLTRNFGRLQANLDLVGSYASIEPAAGSDRDDWIGGAVVRMLHFPDYATTERRIIDTRGYEYTLGFVQHRGEWPGDCGTVNQREDTLFAGVKLTEVIPRTDVQLLSNFFRSRVEGHECRGYPPVREDVDRTSSDLEMNLILTHRILDFVNDMEFRQADRPLGIAQWAVNGRLLQDFSTGSFDDFASRGAVLSSFVELFSGPANRSSIILEVSYQLRHYYHLSDVQHLFWAGFRLGF